MNNKINATIYDILFSITVANDTKIKDDILTILESNGVLDLDEILVIKDFKNLCEEVEGIPRPETLVQHDAMFSTANTILKTSIEDFTKIYVRNKSLSKLQASLTDNAMKLMSDGADVESIVNSINTSVSLYTPSLVNEENMSNLDMEFYKELTNNKEQLKGVPFGIDAIDQIHPGITPGSITVVAGYTGAMKTTLAANIAYNTILKGKNVLYISLEVSKKDLTYNMLSRHSITMSGDSYDRVKIKELAQQEPDKFMEIAEDFNAIEGKFRIVDESDIKNYTNASFTSLFNSINKELKELTGKGFDLLVVDHMQLLKFDENHKRLDPYQVVNNFSSFFRQYTAKNNIATILVSQTSRDGYKQARTHGGRYELTGLAEANELERAATCVITLFSSDALKSSGEIQAQLIKSRNSETMAEPTIVSIRPEFYLVGNSNAANEETISGILNNDFVSAYEEEPNSSFDLESLLGGF